MTRKTSLWIRIVRAILYSRWEPVETLLSICLLAVGFMVLIPGGGTVSSLVGDGDPALVRIVFGLYLITVTLIHLSALSARLPFNKTVREAATLAEFMGFVAITEVAGSVLGWNNYMWVVAATSALISAATYLAMRVGPNGR